MDQLPVRPERKSAKETNRERLNASRSRSSATCRSASFRQVEVKSDDFPEVMARHGPKMLLGVFSSVRAADHFFSRSASSPLADLTWAATRYCATSRASRSQTAP